MSPGTRPRISWGETPPGAVRRDPPEITAAARCRRPAWQLLFADEHVEHYTQEQVVEGYATLRRGGLCLIKGDIGYGLIGHSQASIERMFALKGRPLSNPCITLANLAILEDTSIVEPEVLAFIAKVSAETTLAVVNPVRPSSRLVGGLPPWVRAHATKDDTIASFLNTGAYLAELVAMAERDGVLIVGSSANLSFTGNNYDFSSVPAAIKEGVDFLIDLGPCKYENANKLATTILDLASWRVKRRGVSFAYLHRELELLSTRLGRPINP